MAAKGTIAQRIRHWCAYQERSQNETRTKLKELGVYGEEAEQVIAGLVSENFVNEERFAVAFAGGRFRLRKWGRRRILDELHRHKISAYCVKMAMEAIGEEEYRMAARRMAEKKLAAIGGNDRRKKYQSAGRYLLSKGYEPELVHQVLNDLMDNLEEHELGSEK